MFRGASLWAGIISGGLSQVEDTNHFRKGEMTTTQYAAHTTKNVTMAVGVMAGIEYGAVLGSALLPGVGTIVGSVVGGLVGDRVGRMVGMEAGNLMFNNRVMNNRQPLPLPENNMTMQNHSLLLKNQAEA